MSLLGRIQQAYRSLFSSESIATDQRMEAVDKYLSMRMMPMMGVDGIIYLEDEQVSAQLRYARDNPIPIPKSGLASRVKNYFSR